MATLNKTKISAYQFYTFILPLHF